MNRRLELARYVIDSDLFPRAIVNRVWAQHLGAGFTKPVDDMGPHNPPVLPGVLDRLAKDFRASDFDIKQLTRWIVLSNPYGLSSKAGRGNGKDDPALGGKPLFSRFYSRQMSPEMLYSSLAVAGDHEILQASPKDRAAARNRWVRQFTRSFDNDEGAEFTTFNGTIPQTLSLMNGAMTRQACSTDEGGVLYRLAWNDELSDVEKIDALFLTAFGRRADGQERTAAAQLISAAEGRRDDAGAALQDLYWALLNSNEFILNH